MAISAQTKQTIMQAVAFAGAGLIGLATKVPIRDFVDAATALMSLSGSDALKSITDNVILSLPELERDVIASSVRDMLAQAHISLRLAIELEGNVNHYDRAFFTGHQIADHVINGSKALIVGLSTSEVDKVRTVIATIYKAYLSSSDVIDDLRGDAIVVIFGINARLQELGNQTGAIFRSFAVDHLLDPGARPLPSQSGPDSWLLRPEYGVVPFHAIRLPELNSLLRWATDQPIASIHLIHGRGGAGKTRLAAELISKLRSEGWVAGFLKVCLTTTDGLSFG